MTNEILSIVIWFVSGVVVSLIGMAIFEMRIASKIMRGRIMDLQAQLESLSLQHKSVNDEIFREINETHRKIDDTTNEIYRYIDSRLDKLENKLVDIIKNVCEPAKSK